MPQYSHNLPRRRRSFPQHLIGFLAELLAFARTHKAWWIIPVTLLLLLVAGLIVSVSTISPFIYTLF